MTAEEIERVVGRAICDALGDDWYREGPQGLGTTYDPVATAAILAMDRRASPPAPPVRKVFGWARGVHQPSTPHDPAEYDIDFVYGDDQPSGEGWFAVYREPAPAVAVKPLDWVIQPYYWEAMTPFGRYGAWESESNPSLSYWKAPEDVARREVNGDLAAAKADAQKHFDKLVSALVEPAPAVAVPEGDVLSLIVDALEDAAAGMRYVRQQYGDLPGVGFDRVQEKYLNAVRLLAAAPQPPATRSYEEGIEGVDGQVLMAARTLDDEQRRNPEWLWHSEDRLSFGRWQRHPAQAPYIRADLVVDAIRSLADEPRHDR